MNFNPFKKIEKGGVNKSEIKMAVLALLSSFALEVGAQGLENKNYTIEDLNKLKTETLSLERQLKADTGTVEMGNKKIQYEVDSYPEGNIIHVTEIYKDSTVEMKDGFSVAENGTYKNFTAVGMPEGAEIIKKVGDKESRTMIYTEMKEGGKFQKDPNFIFDKNSIEWGVRSTDYKGGITSAEDATQVLGKIGELFKDDIANILSKQEKQK